jgi:hypothetical protein
LSSRTSVVVGFVCPGLVPLPTEPSRDEIIVGS